MNKSARKPARRGPKAGTTFSCRAPEAGAVFVAGMFNDWNPTATPLNWRPDRAWATTLPLAPGRYEYKFVIDGRWSEPGDDPACPHCVPNPFGTMNRVVEVPA